MEKDDIEYKPTIENDYWSCACVKRDTKTKKMTHIKLNHRTVKRCRNCHCAQKDYYATLRVMRKDGVDVGVGTNELDNHGPV